MNCIMQSISPTKAPKLKATQCFRHSMLTNPRLRIIRLAMISLLLVVTSASSLAHRMLRSERRRLPFKSLRRWLLLSDIKKLVSQHGFSVDANGLENQNVRSLEEILENQNVRSLEEIKDQLKFLVRASKINIEEPLEEREIARLLDVNAENRENVAKKWSNQLLDNVNDPEQAEEFVKHYCLILTRYIQNGEDELSKRLTKFLKTVSGFIYISTMFKNDLELTSKHGLENMPTTPTLPLNAMYFLRYGDDSTRLDFQIELRKWLKPRIEHFKMHYDPNSSELRSLIQDMNAFESSCGFEQSGVAQLCPVAAMLEALLENQKEIRKTIKEFITKSLEDNKKVTLYDYIKKSAGRQERKQLDAQAEDLGLGDNFTGLGEEDKKKVVDAYVSKKGKGAHFFYKQIWDDVQEN